MLFPTTLVGSYPQPDWLIDRAKLAGRFPPRVRARELWRVPEQWLAQAQDDATVLAIKAQEQAGLDIITWTLERSGTLTDGGGFYYQTVTPVINKSGDTYELLDVLARDVGILGIFSDWPGTVTYYANCMGRK